MLTGRMRAAAVLIHLEADQAVSLLRGMPHADLRELTRSMSELRKQGLGGTEVNGALNEFLSAMSTTVEPALRELLERAFGSRRADDLVSELEADARGQRPFDMLDKLDGKQISVMVADEHPQLIALVLSHLDRGKALELLNELPQPLRVDVLERLATMNPASPDSLTRLSMYLAHKSEQERRGQRTIVTPGSRLKVVADLLNKLDGGQKVLEQISTNQSELGQKIKDLMFVFDDLAALDRKAMQKVLGRVDSKLLALSLKSASAEVEENLLKNLSQRAREAVLEERSLLGPTPMRDVQVAQSEIMAIVQEMSSSGEIQVSAGGDAGEYV